MRRRRAVAWPLLAAALAPAAGAAQDDPPEDGRAGWMFGLGMQADEHDARSLLATFEGRAPARGLASAGQSLQLDLFSPSAPDPASTELRTILSELDVDRLTGIEALQLLARMKGLLRG